MSNLIAPYVILIFPLFGPLLNPTKFTDHFHPSCERVQEDVASASIRDHPK